MNKPFSGFRNYFLKKIKKADIFNGEYLHKKILEFQEKENLLKQQSKALAEANANAAIFMAELELKNQALREVETALKKVNEKLEERVQDRTNELQKSNEQLQEEITERKEAQEQLSLNCSKLQRIFKQTAEALAAAVEKRDPYTAGHQKRVAILAVAIARDLGCSEKQIIGINLGAVIHDIGKIYVPIEILTKPTRLTPLETNLIQTHPQIGYEILKSVEFEWPVANIVLQHHERLDGSGYPQKLTGKDTIMEAKIVGVADIIEAMISHRPYHPAHTIEEALGEISKHRGVLYDEDVTESCLRLFREQGFNLKPYLPEDFYGD